MTQYVCPVQSTHGLIEIFSLFQRQNQTEPPRGDVSVRVAVCGVPPRTVLLGDGDGRQKGHRGGHWGVWPIDRHGIASARGFVGFVCVHLDPHHHGSLSHRRPSGEERGELGDVCLDVLFFDHVRVLRGSP